MYQNLPLFSFNVKLLRFLGVIEPENAYKARVIFVIQVITNIFQMLNSYFVRHNIAAFGISLFMTVMIFNSLVRIAILMRNQREFIKLMKEIECVFKEFELNKDIKAWNILKHLQKRTRAISTIILAMCTFTAILAILCPLFLQNHSFPLPIYTNGLDITKSPIFEIVYGVQSLIVFPFVVGTYIPLTNLFISWILFGISLIQILHKKFQELPSGNDPDLLQNLKKLINFHQQIIRYGQTLEKLFSFVCLVEFVLFSFMLCILLLCFLLIDTFVNKIATFMYAFSVFYVLFISYWHTNEFSLESLKLANAVYDIDWIHSSMEVRKCVLILQIRCQTPIKMSAGGIYPMTLESFQAILNGSYAYFNMFNGLMAK